MRSCRFNPLGRARQLPQLRSLMLALRLVGARAPATNTTRALNGGGNRRCPCLTEANKIHTNVSRHLQTYGIGCAKHDLVEPLLYQECASKRPPRFCTAAWCYIDSRACELDHEASGMHVGSGYSYATCGFMDMFAENHAPSALQGKTLQLVQLTNSGGWKGSFCTRFKHCSGPTADIFDSILKDSKALINVTATFLGSTRAEHPHAFPDEVMEELRRDNPRSTSVFTACTYATGMGYVDACIGAFSMMPSRLERTRFVTLWSDPTYLVTPLLHQDAGIWSRMTAAFAPFQPSTWAFIMIFMLSVASLIGVVEQVSQPKSRTCLQRGRIYSFGTRVLKSVYDGLLSFVNGGTTLSPKQPGSRLMNLGLGFVLLITITSYTANLASQLMVQKVRVTPISGLQDVISDPTVKVCATSRIRLQAVGVPREKIVKLKGRSTVMRAVGTAACVAGEVFLEDFNFMRRHGDFCNLTRLGDPLGYQTFGVPTSRRAYRTLSWLFTREQSNGENLKIFDRYPYQQGGGFCGSTAGDDQEGTQKGMGIVHMLGPVSVSTALVFAGACVQARQCYSLRCCERPRDGESKQDSPLDTRSEDAGAGSALSPLTPSAAKKMGLQIA